MFGFLLIFGVVGMTATTLAKSNFVGVLMASLGMILSTTYVLTKAGLREEVAQDIALLIFLVPIILISFTFVICFIGLMFLSFLEFIGIDVDDEGWALRSFFIALLPTILVVFDMIAAPGGADF